MRRILRLLGHCSFIRFGIRNRIIRYFHPPESCTSEEFAVDFFGATYQGNLAAYIDWNVYYFGSYCTEELKLFADILSQVEEPIVMDVGANVGHHSLFLSTVAKQVYSFEPFEEVASQLRQKIALNELRNVHLFAFALGAKEDRVSYSVPTGCNTGTGSFLIDHSADKLISLPVRVADDVVEETSIQRVDFIKIDTEGFERFVLEGLAKTLQRDRPAVFFEWSAEYEHSRTNLETLFPVGYSFFEFISDVNLGVLFRKPDYTLIRKRPHQISDNILALPDEFIERCLASKTSSISTRLANALSEATKSK